MGEEKLSNTYQSSAEDHLEAYRGYSGYEKALSEMMSSFYNAYPEYKNKVALIDLKALENNREAELSRLGGIVGTDNIEAAVNDKLIDGRAFVGLNDQGEKIAVVAGWPIHHQEESDLNFKANSEYTSVTVHELAHAIDYMHGTVALDNGILEANYAESYADSFRISLLKLNGANDHDLKNFIIGYDYRQITGSITDRYDNGIALAQTYNTSSSAAAAGLDAPQSAQGAFYFQHWSKAQEITDKVRQDNIGRHSTDDSNMQETMYKRTTRRSIKGHLNKLIDENIQTTNPQALTQSEGEINAYKQDVEKIIEGLNLKDYEEGRIQAPNEDSQLKIDIAYNTRMQMDNWLENRKGFIPDADRFVAAVDYVQNQGELVPYETPEYNVVKFFGSAAKSYIETGDSQDYNLARHLHGNFDEYTNVEGFSQDKISTDQLLEKLDKDPALLDSFVMGQPIMEKHAQFNQAEVQQPSPTGINL